MNGRQLSLFGDDVVLPVTAILQTATEPPQEQEHQPPSSCATRLLFCPYCGCTDWDASGLICQRCRRRRCPGCSDL